MVNFGSGAFPRTYTGTYAVVNAKADRNECAFTSSFSWKQVIDAQGDTILMSASTYMVLAEDGKSLKVLNTDPQVAGTAPGFVLAFEANKK